jgi:hypothetical protein
MHVFGALVKKYLPKLDAHLTHLGVEHGIYASQWFITLFTYSFPFDLVTRAWDVFLVEGWKSVYRLALAVLKSQESELARMDFDELMHALKELHQFHSAGQLVKIALTIPLTNKLMEKLATEYSTSHAEEIAARVRSAKADAERKEKMLADAEAERQRELQRGQAPQEATRVAAVESNSTRVAESGSTVAAVRQEDQQEAPPVAVVVQPATRVGAAPAAAASTAALTLRTEQQRLQTKVVPLRRFAVADDASTIELDRSCTSIDSALDRSSPWTMSSADVYTVSAAGKQLVRKAVASNSARQPSIVPAARAMLPLQAADAADDAFYGSEDEESESVAGAAGVRRPAAHIAAAQYKHQPSSSAYVTSASMRTVLQRPTTVRGGGPSKPSAGRGE